MRIDIHIHAHGSECEDQLSPAFLLELGGIIHQLETIAELPRGEKMPLSTKEQQIVDRFNTATTAIATKIRDLLANPPADDDEFNNVLSGIADGLEALGAPGDPTTPV